MKPGRSWHGQRPPEENHIVVAAYRERDRYKALLREARAWVDQGAVEYDSSTARDLLVRIDAALGGQSE